MSRLIDADALKQHYAWWGDCGEKGEENKRLFDEIIDLQPTVGGWVSVKDKLPEIKEYHCSDTVLVYCEDDSMCFTEFEETFFGGGVFGCERMMPDGDSGPEVLYWMPLPAPPEVA